MRLFAWLAVSLAPGEAAFYGTKSDFVGVMCVMGRGVELGTCRGLSNCRSVLAEHTGRGLTAASAGMIHRHGSSGSMVGALVGLCLT